MTKTTTASAHTPAPWMVSGTEIQSVKYGRVAHLQIAGYEEKELEANARLIAAAPELLAACRIAMKCAWHSTNYDEGERTKEEEVLKVCEAAITKADGRVPPFPISYR